MDNVLRIDLIACMCCNEASEKRNYSNVEMLCHVHLHRPTMTRAYWRHYWRKRDSDILPMLLVAHDWGAKIVWLKPKMNLFKTTIEASILRHESVESNLAKLDVKDVIAVLSNGRRTLHMISPCMKFHWFIWTTIYAIRRRSYF